MTPTQITLTILLLLAAISCKHHTVDKPSKAIETQAINPSEIYQAANRIQECFSGYDSTNVEYIVPFLTQDSIRVIITHSIEEGVENFFLIGNERMEFFQYPEKFNALGTRRISEYYDVDGKCYVFHTEGISHNSIFLQKLCFERVEKDLSLREMYLLDGD